MASGFSPDSKVLVLGGEWSIGLLNAQTLRKSPEIKRELTEGGAIGFAKETPLFVFLSLGRIKIMQLPNTQVIREISEADMWFALSLSHDGKIIAVRGKDSDISSLEIKQLKIF